MRRPGVIFKQFVGSVSVHSRQGIYIVKGHVCRALFPKKRSPYKGFVRIGNVCCQMVKMDVTMKGVSVRKRSRASIVVPFSAVRRGCGFKRGIRLLYCATHGKCSVNRMRGGMRRIIGGTRLVRPSSKRTIVLIGTRTVFDVMSGLFSNVQVLK